MAAKHHSYRFHFTLTTAVFVVAVVVVVVVGGAGGSRRRGRRSDDVSHGDVAALLQTHAQQISELRAETTALQNQLAANKARLGE